VRKRIGTSPALLLLLIPALSAGLLAQGQKTSTAGVRSKAEVNAGDAEKGKLIFKGRCSICHFTTTTAERVGPGLKDLFKQETLPRSGLPMSEENVRKVILEGSATMQPFRGVLKGEQLSDLLAYLKTL